MRVSQDKGIKTYFGILLITISYSVGTFKTNNQSAHYCESYCLAFNIS